MITGKAPSEVRTTCSGSVPTDSPVSARLAAFLTQTVNLEDGTSVKFEIWYPYHIS